MAYGQSPWAGLCPSPAQRQTPLAALVGLVVSGCGDKCVALPLESAIGPTYLLCPQGPLLACFPVWGVKVIPWTSQELSALPPLSPRVQEAPALEPSQPEPAATVSVSGKEPAHLSTLLHQPSLSSIRFPCFHRVTSGVAMN